MKKKLNGKRWIIVLMVSLLGCTGQQASEAGDTYTCPMHPTVISDKPGVCPVCAMDLVRKARAGEEVRITEDLARLLQDPSAAITSSMSVIRATYDKRMLETTSDGLVTYDTRRIHRVASRIGGRIEKMNVRFIYQRVKAGEVVAELYSPAMQEAQREYLLVLEQEGAGSPLTDAAARKLLLLGATQQQVDNLKATGKFSTRFPVRSQYKGFVVTEEQPTAPASATSAASMNAMGSTTPASAEAATSDLIREGMYVAAGQTLFSVVDDDAVRIELSVEPIAASMLRVDADVQFISPNGAVHQATVDFIQPYFENNQPFVRVRLYVRESDSFRIGELVRGRILLGEVEGLWLPREALLNLGTDWIVFKKIRGVFKPMRVTIGHQTGSWVEVNGLTSGDEVASQAQYLVDSESFVKPVN